MKLSWQTTVIGMLLSMIVGIGGSLAWAQRQSQSRPVVVESPTILLPTKVARSPHVSALGTIAPRGRIRHVAAPSSFSRVGRLMVDEGDQVTPGQVLAHSDDHGLRASELQQAQSQVQIAQSKLDRLLAGPDPYEVNVLAVSLSSAAESYQQRERELERATALAKNDSVSRQELEDAKLRVSLAKFAVQELEAKQRLLESVRQEDVQVLRAELQAAITRKDTASENLSLSEIASPIDGRVLRVHVREGERPGESGILELGDTRQMQAIAEVYEADAIRLKIGSPARVMLKSGGRELSGTVTHVRPVVGRKTVLDNDPVSDADARVVEAVIDLPQQDGLIVQSLSNAAVTVIIEVDEP
jgi:HlyD family secretion protein